MRARYIFVRSVEETARDFSSGARSTIAPERNVFQIGRRLHGGRLRNRRVEALRPFDGLPVRQAGMECEGGLGVDRHVGFAQGLVVEIAWLTPRSIMSSSASWNSSPMSLSAPTTWSLVMRIGRFCNPPCPRPPRPAPSAGGGVVPPRCCGCASCAAVRMVISWSQVRLSINFSIIHAGLCSGCYTAPIEPRTFLCFD